MIANSTLNNLKNKNIEVTGGSSKLIPTSNAQENQNLSILEKINESEIKKNLNATNMNISQLVNNVSGLIEDSNVIFDPRKSLMTENNDDSESIRKGKNVVDKFKHSLPSTVFKKREFVIDKNKINTDEKGNLIKI